MQERTNYRKRIIITIVVLAVVALTVFIVDQLKNATLSILVAPVDAEITINGKKYSNGTYRFFPGEASIKIARDGLDTQEFTMNLESHKTTLLHKYLTKDGNFAFYEESRRDYLALKFIANDDAKAFINDGEQKTQFSRNLPIASYSASGIETVISNASSREDCKRIVCIQITTNANSDDVAKKLLSDYGYKLEDFQIYREKHNYKYK